jgi:hypothetical protein
VLLHDAGSQVTTNVNHTAWKAALQPHLSGTFSMMFARQALRPVTLLTTVRRAQLPMRSFTDDCAEPSPVLVERGEHPMVEQRARPIRPLRRRACGIRGPAVRQLQAEETRACVARAGRRGPSLQRHARPGGKSVQGRGPGLHTAETGVGDG